MKKKITTLSHFHVSRLKLGKKYIYKNKEMGRKKYKIVGE